MYATLITRHVFCNICIILFVSCCIYVCLFCVCMCVRMCWLCVCRGEWLLKHVLYCTMIRNVNCGSYATFLYYDILYQIRTVNCVSYVSFYGIYVLLITFLLHGLFYNGWGTSTSPGVTCFPRYMPRWFGFLRYPINTHCSLFQSVRNYYIVPGMSH